MTIESKPGSQLPKNREARFAGKAALYFTLLAVALGAGCGAASDNTATAVNSKGGRTAATPTFSTVAAQNGADILTLNDSTSGATIYYTTDGSTPTTSSIQYFAPFLVDANVTVKAIATAKGYTSSTVASQAFSPNIPSGTLVWSDEFSNSGSTPAQPNPATWTYDTGAGGFGNQELENYCAWGSNMSPCNSANPNAYVGTDGYLHIVAEQPTSGTYTSARMKSQGLFTFMYGRIEARLELPESQGMWPAFWMLGADIDKVHWPGCGEIDVMENIGKEPSTVHGSLHGPGPQGAGTDDMTAGFTLPHGQRFSDGFHVFGVEWQPGEIDFYVDNTRYFTATPRGMPHGTGWVFDHPFFLLLNLAVGGDWPGNPDGSTQFPQQMLVDYVRVYAPAHPLAALHRSRCRSGG